MKITVARFDGDLICTINNDVIKAGKMFDYPIMYESLKSEKSIVDSRNDEEQVKTQLHGHNSKVGFATNISSSLYSMLEQYPKDSKEYATISDRLRIGRVIQGEIIDSVKGLEVPPFREHWVKPIRITKKMTDEEIEIVNFYNTITCDIRPTFFRFLYPHYMTRYTTELNRYDTYSRINFNKPFNQIEEITTNDGEQELVLRYKEKSYFLDNNSVMNRISKRMRSRVNLTKRYSKQLAESFDYTQLQQQDFENNVYKFEKMQDYYNEFKEFKKSLRLGTNITYDNMEGYISALKKKIYTDISSNDAELASYAVQVTYGNNESSIDFPWALYSDGILQNLLEKSDGTLLFPIPDENGDTEYLWDRYRFEKRNIEDIYQAVDDEYYNDDEEVDDED